MNTTVSLTDVLEQRPPSAATVAKAGRLTVTPWDQPGTWTVIGDHGTYTVALGRNQAYCSCPTPDDRVCAHLLAVIAASDWQPPAIEPVKVPADPFEGIA